MLREASVLDRRVQAPEGRAFKKDRYSSFWLQKLRYCCRPLNVMLMKTKMIQKFSFKVLPSTLNGGGGGVQKGGEEKREQILVVQSVSVKPIYQIMVPVNQSRALSGRLSHASQKGAQAHMQ